MRPARLSSSLSRRWRVLHLSPRSWTQALRHGIGQKRHSVVGKQSFFPLVDKDGLLALA